MTAFDHLERQLREGVRRTHGPARRSWRPPAAFALAAALVVATGALAATGTIRIGTSHEEQHGIEKPKPHVGGGIRAGIAKTLPLRVTDPAGGPPWTLRAFDSSRGGHCIQVGQVVRGHFGIYDGRVLEPLHAWPGGGSSICGGQAIHGLPIVRGLETMRTVGGSSDPHRCPHRPNRDCPITSVTLVRYGLLGPDARRVRLVGPGGTTIASATTTPRTGGAYLFAVARPTAPYEAANRGERAWGEAVQRAIAAARARGASRDEAFAHALRTARPRIGRVFVRPPQVSVIATFADGTTLRVAGHGRTQAPLPGVPVPDHRVPALPRDRLSPSASHTRGDLQPSRSRSAHPWPSRRSTCITR